MRYQKKMQHQQKSKKILVLIAGLIILLAIFSYLFISRRENTSIGDNASPTQEQVKESSDIDAGKKDSLSQNTSSDQPSEKGNSNQSTPTNSTSQGKIEISASQDNSGNVIISTKLYNFSSGSCTLLASNDSKSWSKVVSIIYQPEFSTCAGFSIPASSSLGAGTWTISLEVNENGIKSSKTITFEVNL